MYKHVLFDLDGTLVDTLPLIEWTYGTLLANHPELGVSWQDAIKLLGLPLRDILARLVPQDKVQQLSVEYMRLYRERHDELLRSYPGMLEAVSGMVQEGVVVGVVTSKVRETAERALRDLGLLDLMDVIVTSEDVRKHKPNPEPIMTAMRRLGCAADATAYAGDSPFDMMAGRAAGVAVIGVTWGAFPKAELEALSPDHMADTPSQLLACVLGQQAGA